MRPDERHDDGEDDLSSSRVEAPGIETPETSGATGVDRRRSDADRATQDDSKRREVLASAHDVDAAIRGAAKVAIDAGDLVRARALLDLLDAKPPAESVLTLAGRKPA
jgi:hypothetical protein